MSLQTHVLSETHGGGGAYTNDGDNIRLANRRLVDRCILPAGNQTCELTAKPSNATAVSPAHENPTFGVTRRGMLASWNSSKVLSEGVFKTELGDS